MKRVIWAVLAAVAMFTPAHAGTLSVIGPSAKVCQLTGQTDWATNQPTAAQTFTNFGLDSVDLGFPVDSDAGPLYFLFGDAFPLTHGFSNVPPDDALGFTSRTTAPDPSTCLDMQLATSAPHVFAHPTVLPKIEQGSFNVPSGGIFLDGTLYAFFWTNHCVTPPTLTPLPATPLVRPAPSAGCPETDTANAIGSSVLAGALPSNPVDFHHCPLSFPAHSGLHCSVMPSGFNYVTAAEPPAPNLRDARVRLPDHWPARWVAVYGAARYRASIPYMAVAPRDTFADPTTWSFFAGRKPNGDPIWVTPAEWESGKDAMGNWVPPAGAEIYDASPVGQRCVGEHSVTWNPALGTWLLFYNCGPWTVLARTASEPWGPWSAPVLLLQATPTSPLVCTLIMSINGCGPSFRNYWPGMPGIFYAPFPLTRYTQPAPPQGQGRAAVLYWLLSTWNPYQVTVMQTTLQMSP